MPLSGITAQDIEDRVVEILLAIGIEGIDNATEGAGQNLFVRETPDLTDRDPSPCCVVVVGNEHSIFGPGQTFIRTNSTWNYQYPVLILMGWKKSLTHLRSLPEKKIARQKIRNNLRRHFLLGKDGPVRQAEYDPEPEFTTAATEQGWKVSGQAFLYYTEEPRTC